ncbi:uncharacterized protein [Clytia hemisphaerica]|uniref:uncharacterized protein n=1 Tax=Clytia hemisphaerica TaxID=252671 RepID=UPI0034D60C8D
MGRTEYNPAWEEKFIWITKDSDVTKAHCKFCKKSFKINNRGENQVKSHADSDTHKKHAGLYKNQKRFVAGTANLSSGTFTLSSQDEILRAEAVHSLFYVNRNIPYSCSTEQTEIFKSIFPCELLKSFTCGATKMSYLVKHGLAPFFEKEIMDDIDSTPFGFKFDETTTKQVKKQYDAYATYWSKATNQVESSYLGSLFVGHCKAVDLVDHYLEFKQRWHLNDHLLLQMGMDGPNVNLAFEKILQKKIKTNSSAEILQLGTCSLHPVHSAFRKGLSELDFPFDSFFHDLSFYFHLSSARREDYKSMEEITEVTAEYVKKHGPTRWLSMKPVGARVLEQIKNLKKYFFTYLPKSDGFRKCERYERIVKILKRDDLEAYLGFMLYFSQDFESFLREFQFSIPMIHVLWPRMADLTRNLMTKFVRRRWLFEQEEIEGKRSEKKPPTPVSNHDIFGIDVTQDLKCKKPAYVEIGAKAKVLFSGNLFSNEKEEQFRKNCLKCFQISVGYLLNHLPHDKKLIEYAQYLHPLKRNTTGSNSGISNATLYIAECLGPKIEAVFKCAEKFEIVDKVRSQWARYQLEDIPEDTYTISQTKEKQKSSQKKYWEHAYEVCGLEPEKEPTVKFKRIDHYWRFVGQLTGDDGKPKYPHLYALVKCILCLSHGNAIPERGFSINKRIIEAHVKDAIARAGGVLKVPITRSLLQSVKEAHARSVIEQQLRKEKEEISEKQKAEREKLKRKNAEADTVDDMIRMCKEDIKTAENGEEEANNEIREAIIKKDMKAVQTAQTKLTMAIESRKRWVADLDKLKAKKKK